MSESIASVLVWFRNDLRVEDHQGLQQALASQKRVIAYYSFSPKLFQPTAWGFKKTEKYRAQFLIESVAALKNELQELNISLIIDLDAAEDSLADYLQQYDVQTVYLQEEWTEEEKKKKLPSHQKPVPPSNGFDITNNFCFTLMSSLFQSNKRPKYSVISGGNVKKKSP